MRLSILIPTLERRKALYEGISMELRRQIAAAGLEREVEVLSLCDRGEVPTGTKRNRLLEMATGDFVVFVDDDDEVSADYVSRICQTLEENPGIDCIGIQATITFRGAHARRIVHSLRYADYSSKGGVYRRPPYHLNPIRREIAASYRFLDVYYSEDIEWALRVRQDPRMRSEAFVDSTLYFYRCRRHYAYQWLLDVTEGPRHLLGIRFTNRFFLYATFRKWMGFKDSGALT